MKLIGLLNDIIWGLPLILLLMFTHIYFTLKTSIIQRSLSKGIKISFRGNAFATLSTTLAATLGTGNIIGMSTAIFMGGPGAVLWCWLTGVLGMATCYCECYIGMKYKDTKNNKGGPMYALKYGLGMRKMAIAFAIFTMLSSYGVGCTTQANALSSSLNRQFHIATPTSGLICAILTGMVIIGGIKSISKFCTYLVPFMSLIFFAGCVFILIKCNNYIFPAIKLIIFDAFSFRNIALGTSSGIMGMFVSARYGIARGLFTNEAGLGSTAIAAGSSQLKSCHEQGLVSMSSVFWDTVVMCSITGVVIVSAMLKSPLDFANGDCDSLMNISFSLLGSKGDFLLSLCIVMFAFATLCGWFFFGESAAYYLINQLLHKKNHKEFAMKCYKISYIVMIFFGAVMNLELVWEMCDLFNALMVCPNLVCLFLLREEVKNNVLNS